MRKMFDTLVVLICWSLWLERNACTFNGEVRTAEQLVRHIGEEVTAWVRAFYSSVAMFAQSFDYRIGRQDMDM